MLQSMGSAKSRTRLSDRTTTTKVYCDASALNEHGDPLHYSCLGNPSDRGAWWATCEVSEDESRGAQRARGRSVVESEV